MYKHGLSILLIMVFSIGGASAAVKQLDLGEIVTQQKQIQADVVAGKGRFKEMPQTKKDELISKQSEVLNTIGDKRDPNALSKDQRIAMFNSLEWIEATINDAAGDEMVCGRERRTGSNRVQTVCKTRRQINEAHERARRQGEGSMPLSI